MRETAWKIGLLLGFVTGLVVGVLPTSDASRNSAGSYSLPSGNPVVTGTTITSSWANNTLSDIGTELTSSLDRNGRGAMLAPLQCTSGTVSAPGLTFSGDTDTGLYRLGANHFGVTVGGVLKTQWRSPNGIEATGSSAGAGGVFTGGATGHGATGTSSAASGHGFFGTGGTAAGAGVYGLASVGTGFGVVGQGIDGGFGGSFVSSSTSVPVLQAKGYIDLDESSYPASTDAVKDKVTPGNIIKAWALIQTGASPSVVAGFNVASVSCAGSLVTVNWQQDFASASYAAVTGSSAVIYEHEVITRAAGSAEIVGVTGATGTPIDLCVTSHFIDVLAIGAQ
jgi:hypothetical protein